MGSGVAFLRNSAVDWRYFVLAGLMLLLLGGLLWKRTLGAPPPVPTAPAPKGATPSYVAPDSP